MNAVVHVEEADELSIDREDRSAIRDIVECWAVWRDAGEWERLRNLWHPGGRMCATFFQGDAREFVARGIAGKAKAGKVVHALGGMAIEIARLPAGARAIVQTKMQIIQRDTVDGVLCDVVCTGRFYDFFEKRDERWGIVLRQPIYELDRLDPVASDRNLTLDAALLDRFPEGYRHLAYLQTKLGMTVKTDMPGLTGPQVEKLYADGASWLRGETLDR